MNVLLVEDEQYLQAGIRRVLEQMGHQVTVASNGEEGLAAVQAAAFDLIVSDFNMPRMTGLELYAQLDPKMQQRFVLHSGNLEVLEQAPDSILKLPKPASVPEFRSVISDFLNAKEAADG